MTITKNFVIEEEGKFQIKNSNLFSSLLFLDKNGILGKIPSNEIIEKIEFNNSIIKNSKIFINSEEFADKNFVGNILIREAEVINDIYILFYTIFFNFVFLIVFFNFFSCFN